MKTTLDLGSKMEPLKCCSPEAEKAEGETRINYPTVWLSDLPGLDKLPDGEFSATVKFKKTRSVEETRMENGKETESYSATLDLLSIEFDAASEKEDETENETPTAESAFDSFLGKSD